MVGYFSRNFEANHFLLSNGIFFVSTSNETDGYLVILLLWSKYLTDNIVWGEISSFYRIIVAIRTITTPSNSVWKRKIGYLVVRH